MKRLLILPLLLLALVAHADRVRVRLFSTNTISTLNISFDLGQYNLYADDSLLLEPLVGEGRSVLVRCQGGRLAVSVKTLLYAAAEIGIAVCKKLSGKAVLRAETEAAAGVHCPET